MKYGNFSLDEIEALIDRIGGDERTRQLIKGELCVIKRGSPENISVPDISDSLNFVVHVNRNRKEMDENWMRCVETRSPDLRCLEEYDLRELKCFSPHEKANNWMGLLKHYEGCDMLNRFLDWSDLLMIQEKGLSVFNNVFKEERLFGPRTIAYDYREKHHWYEGYIPYLTAGKSNVNLKWYYLLSDIHSSDKVCFF